MEIRSVRHKGLWRWLEHGQTAGLPAAYVRKIEAIVSYLSAAPDVEAVRKLTVWRARLLTGELKGTWSLTVSRNWRLTFKVNTENEIEELDLVDYH